MISFNFSYDEQKSKIESEDIPNYLNLKNFLNKEESEELKPFQNHLLETFENSIVVSIYTLSEQLLKKTIYSLLEISFDEKIWSHKDKFILKRMPPDSYPVTPTFQRIVDELSIYNSDFKLYSHPWIETLGYKEAYKKIIDARHKFAHENRHTTDISDYFHNALEYIDYLNVSYSHLLRSDSTGLEAIRSIFLLANYIAEFKKFNSYTQFSAIKNKLSKDKHISRIKHLEFLIETIEEVEDVLECKYLNELYEQLQGAFKILKEFEEDNFQEKFEKFCEQLDGFNYNSKYKG